EIRNDGAGMIYIDLGFLENVMRLKSDDIGYAPLPAMNGVENTTYVESFNAKGITAASDNPQAAWAFLSKYLLVSNEINADIAHSGLTLSKKVLDQAGTLPPNLQETLHASALIKPKQTAAFLS